METKAYETHTSDSFVVRNAQTFVYFIFIIIGAGTLFPWNAYIMALDYFSLIYPDLPFAFILPIVYNCFSVTFFVLSMFFAHLLTARFRVFTFFGVDFVCLAIVPVFAMTLESDSLVITFICVAFTGAATAILTGTAVGIASSNGTKFVTAIMIGQGFAGIIPAIIRVITKASLPADHDGYLISGIVYFVTSAVFIVLCIIGFALLEFYPPFVKTSSKFVLSTNSVESERKALLDDGEDVEEIKTDEENVLPVKRASVVTTFKKLWKEAVATFFVFFVTLSLFPGMTNRIASTSPEIGDWFMVITSSFFMVFDLVGRMTPSFKWAQRWTKYLMVESFLRFVFYPLFFIVIYQVLWNDVFTCAVMTLFAFTNGYVGTMCMDHGTDHCSKEEKQMGGDIMGLSLNTGILIASFFGYALNKISEGAPM